MPPQDQVLPHDLHQAKVPNLAHCTKAAIENDMRLKSKQASEALHAGKFKKKIKAALPVWQPAVKSPTNKVSPVSSSLKSSLYNSGISVPENTTDSTNISNMKKLEFKSKTSDINLSTNVVDKNQNKVTNKFGKNIVKKKKSEGSSVSSVTVITDSEDEGPELTQLKSNQSAKSSKSEKPLITKAFFYESSDDDEICKKTTSRPVSKCSQLKLKNNTLDSTPVFLPTLKPEKNFQSMSELENNQQKGYPKKSSPTSGSMQMGPQIPISRPHSPIYYKSNCHTNKNKISLQQEKPIVRVSPMHHMKLPLKQSLCNNEINPQFGLPPCSINYRTNTVQQLPVSPSENCKTKILPQQTALQIQKNIEPYVLECPFQKSSPTLSSLPSSVGSPSALSRHSSNESSINEPRLKDPRLSVSSLVHCEGHLPNPFDKMDCGKSKRTSTSEDDTVNKVTDPRLLKNTYRKNNIGKSSCVSISKLSKDKNSLPELLKLVPQKKQLVSDGQMNVVSDCKSSSISVTENLISDKNVNEVKRDLDVYRKRLIETIDKCNMYAIKTFRSHKKVKQFDVELKRLKKLVIF